MTEDIEKYNTLKDLVFESDHTAIEFFEFCELHKNIHGKSHPLCYYKALLSSIALGEDLSEQEEIYLLQLYTKFGKVDVEYLLMCDPVYNPFSEKSIKRDFKYVYNKISEGAKQRDQSALAELGILLRNNLDFSFNNNKENGPMYNPEAEKELYQICEHFTEQKLMITDSFFVRLTPRTLIHIITGHTEKNKIPRKGLLLNFHKSMKWYEILYLIYCIVQYVGKEIIASFNEKNRYDNKAIVFEGNKYGLHIHKNKSISSFYPVTDYKI
jgi:hypothetical protein